jgi:glycosyltransferase involved in cell wall biosynthesis
MTKGSDRNSDAVLIVPAYNEGRVIKDVVNAANKKFEHIVCVNDGSSDDTKEQILKTKAVYVEHPINMGQGAAIQTGVDYALQHPEIKYYVTFDADGQHRTDDVEKMLDYLRSNPVDIVLGSRFLGRAENISALKRVILKLAVLFSNVTTGLHLTDAHNGLRVFNTEFAKKLKITHADMAHASEIIQRIADTKTPFKEFPVTIEYTDYSVENSHNPTLNAVNIVFDTLLGRIVKK